MRISDWSSDVCSSDLHVPRPFQLAGDRVETADHPRGRPAILPVEHLMPGDDHAAYDGRRRVDRDIARRRVAHADPGIDLAVGAEILARPARRGVERE